MDYGNYYEQFNGDEVVVHLDYLEPEPSLYQQSRGRGRPTLHREYTPVRTSKQSLSRRRASDAFAYNQYYDEEEHEDDFRDDDIYEQMTSRVAIQEQRYDSNRFVDKRRPKSREYTVSDAMGSSGRSVVSRNSISTRKKNTNKKVDLTGSNADSSFEVLATLLVEHLEPKVQNSHYTLEEGDMVYFDAIMPETLRVPFVEAVRFRSERLPAEVGKNESNLDMITRKCYSLGLGGSPDNNFLLGGGHKVEGKTIIRLDTDSPIKVDSHGSDEHNVDTMARSTPQLSPTHVDGASARPDLNQPKSRRQIKSKKDIESDALQSFSQYHEENQSPLQEKNEPKEKRRNSKKGKESINQVAVFDLTIKKEEEKRKKKSRGYKSQKSSIKRPVLTAAMSVVTSPSNLDMTVAAFEHEWRDGLWDIFAHGVCHPLVFLSFFAPIFALGQVMTRLKLNWIGMPSDDDGTKYIFSRIGTIVVVWLALNLSAISLCIFAWTYVHYYIEALSFTLAMSNLWFYGFCVFATGNTRRYIRDIYNIKDGAGLSDYMLAAAYMPFTIAQMGRHTADYNSLQARMCSTTGLMEGADHSFIANLSSFNNSFGMYKSFNDEDTATSFGDNATHSHRSERSLEDESKESKHLSRWNDENEEELTASSPASSSSSLV